MNQIQVFDFFRKVFVASFLLFAHEGLAP